MGRRLRKQLDHGLVPFLSGHHQRCPTAVVVVRVDVDLARLQQQLDYRLVPMTSCNPQRCLAKRILRVDVDLARLQQ